MNRLIITLFIFVGILLFGCKNDTSNKDTETYAINEKQSKPLVGLIDGKIFCVPSPYEFVRYIKELDIPYNHALLNPTGNRSLYESSFQKSLNFGIYGIDLAYLNIFQQTSDGMNYFATLKSLSEQLDLSSIFDVKTMERLENNMSIQDSLLIILTNKYRSADKRLKNEKQRKEAALIIAGSWIESLYLITQINKEKPNKRIEQRIAEHKFAADNILSLLRPYYNASADYKYLVESIVNICYQFDGVSYEYTYKKPITYPDLKTTIITSETIIVFYPEHLKNITDQIEKLRNTIIK